MNGEIITFVNNSEIEDACHQFEVKYSFGEPVTRENLVAMLLKSFAAARGSLSRHRQYLEELGAVNGFDYKDCLQGYFAAGGHECLSRGEQHHIEEVYSRVKKHDYLGDYFMRDWDMELEQLIRPPEPSA